MDSAVRIIRPYLWGVVAIAICSVFRVTLGALIPWSSPYMFFIVGVVVVAYNFGFWPGSFVAIGGTLMAEVVFVRYSMLAPGQEVWQRVVTFLVQALPVCYICGVRMKTAVDRTAALEAERTARVELASTAQELARSEGRYRGMIAAVPQIVFVADAKFNFEWVNDRWEGLTGKSDAEAYGAGWLSAVDPCDREAVIAGRDSAVRFPRVLNVELRLLEQASGRHRWQLVRAVPVTDPSGALVQWVGTFTDIEDSKRLLATMQEVNDELELRVRMRTDELVEVNRDLEAANAELEAFCYAVSHDLRTPLRAIDGFSQALSQDYGALLPDDGRSYLDRVRSGARRMDELITSLLKLSRIARQELSVQPIDVSEIAAAAWADLGHVYKNHSAEFRLEPGLTALADPKLLRIVFDNLLGNALKFTAKQPEAWVEVGAKVTENGCAFFVKDNGVGFSMEYASKLFAPFERLHSPREYPGSGVGLATVMRCVRKHGGDAWAAATEGAGATFFFTLEPTARDA